MRNNYSLFITAICFLLLSSICLTPCNGQILSLKTAVEKGAENYGIVRAKAKYAAAANETIKQVKRDYLPNLNLSAQQDYGTINGQNGPSYGLGGLGVSSSGPALANQNWNSAFGALYLVNTNWEFFTFGRIAQRITLAKADAARLEKDYEQELFQQKVKIAGAYLNLLASQRLLRTQQKNLERTAVFLQNAATRVKNGLLPGVDSTQAAAEVSRAKIALNQIREQVKLQNNELAQLMGEKAIDFVTDTALIARIPTGIANAASSSDSTNHPTRQFFQSRIRLSKEQERLFKKEFMPTFNFFGVYQARASGFSPDYLSNQNAFTSSYLTGVDPTRQNYLLGIGMVWNLTSIARSSKKVSYQRLVTQGLQEEYKTIDLELHNREDAANARLGFALQNYNEAPNQVQAAQQAYLQRTTLYRNGLTNLTDVTTALFVLNRAETDRDIAFTNVWQALLMKAATVGDFNLFLNQF